MSDRNTKVKKAKEDIWMPLYIGDYMSSTGRLTTEQHGAYMLMIMDYWKNGPIPNDDAVICQITKLHPNAFSKSKALLVAFFEQKESSLRHRRIDEEKAKAITRVELHHARAVAAADARWKKHDATSNATSTPKAIHEECQSQSQSQSQFKTSHIGADSANEVAGVNAVFVDGKWREVDANGEVAA